MRFLADECIDRQIVEHLREDGHDVAYIAEMSPGIADEAVLSHSRTAASVLVTADKDFGELVFRQRQATAGVFLLRLPCLKPAMKASLVSAAVRDHAFELSGVFAVLSRSSLRIRRGPAS